MYVRRCLLVKLLVPCETAAVSARSVYTIQLCTMSRHFLQTHIRMVHPCLGRMTGIFLVLLWKHGDGTGTEIRVSSESCPWRRKFSCYSCRLEHATFRSRVRRANHWAIPAWQAHINNITSTFANVYLLSRHRHPFYVHNISRITFLMYGMMIIIITAFT